MTIQSRKAATAKYRASHKEQIKESSAAYREKQDSDIRKFLANKYYQENKEQIKAKRNARYKQSKTQGGEV